MADYWSKTVEEAGVQVRLYQRKRGGNIYRAVILGRVVSKSGKVRTKQDRKSLKHSNRAKAETQAKALAEKLAKARFVPPPAGAALTLGDLFDRYKANKAETLSGQWKRAALTRLAMFEAAWGRETLVGTISQTHVDDYCAKRRSLAVLPPRLHEPAEGEKPGRGYRKPRAVRDGTLDADFRFLSSVFNWARRHKLGSGDRLLSDNPLHDDVKWPKEKNVRRPVASHQRYTATQEHTDAVDATGRLRCILTLARYTGRRESAICGLRAGDLLLTEDRIRAALAASGMDEGIAEHMPNGAIRWAPETDKQGLLHVTPMHPAAREAVDAYLRASPRMGDVPLFPATGDPEKPIRRETAATLLLQAETAANLPKLVGGIFHPYRRLWATERRNMPDADVAAAGGWKDVATLRKSYQSADAETVLRVVQNGG